MDAEHPQLWLKVVNVLSFVSLISTHAYFALARTQDVYSLHPTNLTPALWASYILAPIYALLAALLVWQFLHSAQPIVQKAIGPWFAVSAASISLWFVAWTEDQLLVAFFLALVPSFSLFIIALNLIQKFPNKSLVETVLVHWPISALHAWLVFINWLTLAAFLATLWKRPEEDDGSETGSQWEDYVYVYVWLLFQIPAAIFSKSRKIDDPIGLLVTAWTVITVALNHPGDSLIYYPGVVCGVVIILYALKSIWSLRNQPKLEEGTPAEREPLV
ncbi:uncharacterized protein BJ171DRAFT_520103 [Polychytrium aggregatum]|uniref:uncharacterized protein n=1 Tax=Polychytrium aggregatum TaxID=110093 RepID=UPI0022FECB9D|nr:uncharacterized protein BJ171DRAFT_520103 [Polychytrium aggregatum]KAI9197376.1 hypothetical protein BJ171DRAFT_520103 [Polychytrium aggregatum]